MPRLIPDIELDYEPTKVKELVLRTAREYVTKNPKYLACKSKSEHGVHDFSSLIPHEFVCYDCGFKICVANFHYE